MDRRADGAVALGQMRGNMQALYMKYLSLLLLVVASLLAAACGGSEGSATTINLGLPTAQTSFANADVMVAQEQGFFEEQGIQVEVQNFSSGLRVAQAIISGDLQIGASSIEPVINASAQGGQLSIIGGYADRLTVSMVTPGAIESVADLRGQNLGIQDVGAFREVMTRMVLESGGLTADDVTYRPIEANAYTGALLSGQISSAILQAEQTAETSNQDPSFHELADLYEVEPEYYYGTYFAQKDWLSDNADNAVRFLTAITQAHRFMYDNKEETVPIVAEATGFDPEIIDQAYEKLLVQNGVFPVNEGLEEERLTYTLERMRGLGLLEAGEPNMSELVDREPISQVVENLGTLEGDPRWH
jgi:NitT/TauT family transport system substrate-binding protein